MLPAPGSSKLTHIFEFKLHTAASYYKKSTLSYQVRRVHTNINSVSPAGKECGQERHNPHTKKNTRMRSKYRKKTIQYVRTRPNWGKLLPALCWGQQTYLEVESRRSGPLWELGRAAGSDLHRAAPDTYHCHRVISLWMSQCDLYPAPSGERCPWRNMGRRGRMTLTGGQRSRLEKNTSFLLFF